MNKRLIPVLLLDRKHRLVKTTEFGSRTYIGDPFNVLRLFNEKEVDEICILDIDASRDGRQPDFGFIRELASECFMPLSYGGGIKSLKDCERLNRDGVEKFVLGRGGLDSKLVTELSKSLGAQAVVACVDVKKNSQGTYCISTSVNTALTPLEYCKQLESAGVGEIILQSVDCDGCRNGYDLTLIAQIAPQLKLPLIALGGAGRYEHLSEAIEAGASAAASGSVFCFIGRLRAVLINYPDSKQREAIFEAALT